MEEEDIQQLKQICDNELECFIRDCLVETGKPIKFSVLTQILRWKLLMECRDPIGATTFLRIKIVKAVQQSTDLQIIKIDEVRYIVPKIELLMIDWVVRETNC